MRILLSFPYALGRVGVGRTALEQANGLARRGHDVLVAAPLLARGAVLEEGVVLHQTRLLGGRRIPQRLLRRPTWSRALHDLRTTAWLRAQQQSARIDVLHAWPLSGARTMHAARGMGVTVLREAPNTHTAHAYDVVEREAASLGLVVPAGNSHARDGGHLAAEQREWDAADAILAPSDAVAESFLERGVGPVIRHRYGCELPPVPTASRPDRPLHALFLGAAEPRKGLHHALAAWTRSRASRDGRLRIAGTFMPGYREHLEPLLRSAGVEVLGFVDDPAALLRDADVLLLPSVEEGSAIVTYEAQAVGCVPLVSHQAGALAEPGAHALVHEAGDVCTLVAHLDAVAADRALLARLRANCLRDRARLSWDAAAGALEDAYRAAVDRAGVRS